MGSPEEMKLEIEKLEREVHRQRQEKHLAQARVYELQHKGEWPPTEIELKSRIVYLEEELRNAIAKRDEWKRKAQNGQ